MLRRFLIPLDKIGLTFEYTIVFDWVVDKLLVLDGFINVTELTGLIDNWSEFKLSKKHNFILYYLL